MQEKNSFPFGYNVEEAEPTLDFDAPISGDSILSNAPEYPSGDGGASPTSPLQSSKIIKAVNACDAEHNAIRVPVHLYSDLCCCELCSNNDIRKSSNLSFQFPEIGEQANGTYSCKSLRFGRIYESEARNFILPRNYLRRWFVGATLCYGAKAPDGNLVAACVLSAPGAYSKRFTPRNTKEIRRFVMLDNCERNSESRFIAWIIRETKKICPHLRYILTFGNPKYDKESAYKAAGFQMQGVVDCSAQWISHKSHRARESKDVKHRFVYTYK